MKDLLKLVLVLALFFASTFLIVNISGILTIEQVKTWLQNAFEFSPVYVGGLVIILLFCDLFIAVPTLTITLLSGYFLGFPLGGVCAFTGMMLAGLSGYVISSFYGHSLFTFLIKDKNRRSETASIFKRYGFAMILMSRAAPILPEVTACLAGLTKMSFPKFMWAWFLSSIPYAMLASYAGSISTLDNPMPAIYTAIAMSAVLWMAWFIFNRYQRKNELPE